MRALVALALVAVVGANNYGYNYHQGGGAVGVGVGVGVGQQGLISPNVGGGSLGGGPIGANSDVRYSFSPGAGAAGVGAAGGEASSAAQSQQSFAAPVEEFNKEFFSYSAPEESFEERQASQKVESTLKKNLRVIFIKGPENKGLENAVLNLAKHSSEQRTAIYVLNQQTDLNDLASKFNAINSNTNNEPEVHFVKYRTADDAAKAQHQIQAQYNSLQGPSQSHEAVGSALNFASQGPAFGSAVAESRPAGQATNLLYLPPSVRQL